MFLLSSLQKALYIRNLYFYSFIIQTLVNEPTVCTHLPRAIICTYTVNAEFQYFAQGAKYFLFPMIGCCL